MFREAFYRGTLHQPLVEASRNGWTRLEIRSGAVLMTPTSALMVGRPGDRVFGGCATPGGDLTGGLELLSAPEIRERFRAFRVDDGSIALLEPNAGILDLDACLETTLGLAVESGADLRFEESVTSWRVERGVVELVTGSVVTRARRLALCAGAWTPVLAADLALPLEVERTVQHWFEPREPGEATALEPGSCPAWVWEHEPGGEWYGFPLRAGEVKVGIHVARGRATTADGVDRSVSIAETEAMGRLLRRHLPDAAGRCTRSDVCLYTTTPDRRFVLDRHPEHPEVALFSGGSGHAFKFAPVLGALLADLTTDQRPDFDIAPFSATRF